MRAVLFDLDETILDHTGSLRKYVSWHAENVLNLDASNTALFVDRFIALDQRGVVWKDKVYETLIEEFQITGWSVEELVQAYLLTFCAFCKPRCGAIDAIEEFKNNGFKIGLVSNGRSPFQERKFNSLGFNHLFDCITVSEAVGMRKPDKAIFEHACHKLSANLSSSVFIGDNPVADIKGAKDAGMSTVYVPVESDYEPCEFADVTYENLSELVGYIEREK